MGSCYSCKASGGKYTYTTVPMASPQLDDGTKSNRPTPYSRIPATSAVGFGFKRRPMPTAKHSQLGRTDTPTSRTGTPSCAPSQGCQVQESKLLVLSKKNQSQGCVKISPCSSLTNMNISGQSGIPRIGSTSQSRQCLEERTTANPANTDSNSNKLGLDDNSNANLQFSKCSEHVGLLEITTEKHSERKFPGNNYGKQSHFAITSKNSEHVCSAPQNKVYFKSVKSEPPIKATTQISRLPTKLATHVGVVSCSEMPKMIRVPSGNSSTPQLSNYVESSGKMPNKVSSILGYAALKDGHCKQDKDKISSNHTDESLQSIKPCSVLSEKTAFECTDDTQVCERVLDENCVDGDSGIGSSFSEKEMKLGDSESLKDLESLKDFEGSPMPGSSSRHTSPPPGSSSRHTSPPPGNAYPERKVELPSSPENNSKKMREGDSILHTTQTATVGRHGQRQLGIDATIGNKRSVSFNSSYTNGNSVAFSKLTAVKQFSDLVSSKKPSQKECGHTAEKDKGFPSLPKARKQVLNEGNCAFNQEHFLGSAFSQVTADGVKQTLKDDNFNKTVLSKKSKSSPENTEKSDSSVDQGFLSPLSDIENREFLIDDEIFDQPGLITFEQVKLSGVPAPSLQQSVTELRSLRTASHSHSHDHVRVGLRESLLSCSDVGSSCSSLASDDLMLDYEKSFDILEDSVIESSSSPRMKQRSFFDANERKVGACDSLTRSAEGHLELSRRRSWQDRRSAASVSSFTGTLPSKPPLPYFSERRHRSASVPLRPPRQITMLEGEGGSVILDPSSYRSVCQDLQGVKTMLLRLKRVLHEAETLNPFDASSSKTLMCHSLTSIDNVPPDLLKQWNLEETGERSPDLSSQLQEKVDLYRQVILLREQLEEKDHTVKLLQQQMAKYMKISEESPEPQVCTAATQTEKTLIRPVLPRSCSVAESSGTFVSSRVRVAVEEHLQKSFKGHASFHQQMAEVTKSLSSINQSLRSAAGKSSKLCRRSVSTSELTPQRKDSM